LTSIPRSLVYLLLATCLSLPGSAQSFVFASPNTREHMSDEAALASRDSFEQQNFLAVARYLAARLCAAPKIESSEGLDGQGAENSLLITGCRGKPAVYLAELIARYGRQRWALIFDADAKTFASHGPGSNSGAQEMLFVITLSNLGSQQALQQMRRHGLSEGAVISNEKRVVVYVWTKDATANESVRAFAQASHGELREIHGRGFLIGDQDRAQAQRILDRDIAAYERRHNVALSRELWSRRLHDMGLTFTPAKTSSSPAKTTPVDRDAPSVPPSRP
jgi:hypothetical protein